MRYREFDARLGSLGLPGLSVIVATVVTLTAFEASAHGHLPAADGWHDETTHGDTADDAGLKSCSICRLAHETSSGPVTPDTVSRPLRHHVPRIQDRSAIAPAAPAREHSPRAPPCLASC